MHIEVLQYFVKQNTHKTKGINILKTYMSHIQATKQNLIWAT